MTPLLTGFANELAKQAGVAQLAKTVGRAGLKGGKAIKELVTSDAPGKSAIVSGLLSGGLALASNPHDPGTAIREAVGFGGGQYLGERMAGGLGIGGPTRTGRWARGGMGWLGGALLAKRLHELGKHPERPSPGEHVSRTLSKLSAAAPRSYVLKSSNLRGMNYDPSSQDLTVTFKSGGTYKYKGVPPNVAKSIRRNKSPGKAFHRRVKQGGYEWEKISSGDMLQYFQDHPDKLREKRERDRKKALRKRASETDPVTVLERLQDKHRRMRKQAGAAKRQITFDGVKLKLEYEPGDERSGVSKDGHKWSKTMRCSYGYVPGTKGDGLDGDAIDIYLAKDPVLGMQVYRVNQLTKDGRLDEHKFLLGFGSIDAAKKCYLDHMPSWAFGSITTMSMDAFRRLVGQSERKAA